MTRRWSLSLAIHVCGLYVAPFCAEEVPISTAEGLQRAVDSSARAVVITEHIDVRQLRSQDGFIFVITDDISIRGDCGQEPPQLVVGGLDPALLPREPRQCLILTSDLLFEVRSTSFAKVRMDNIYVRLQQRIISPLTVTLMAFSGTSAWCSHMTLQGDHGIQRALLPFKNAAVHISDSTFANFNSTAGPLMMIENNSSAVFERCSFAGIVNRQANGSAITARNVDRSSRTSSTVLVRESTLANVTSPFFSFNKPSGGRFYSDMPLDVFHSIPGEHTIFAAEPAQDAQPVGGAMFLREADRPSVLDISEPTPPEGDSPNGSADTQLEDGGAAAGRAKMGAIAGGVAAAVTSVLLIILFIWAFMKKNSGTETTEEAREPYSKMVDYPVEVSQSGLTSSDNAQRCTTVTSSSGAEFTNMPDSVGGPGGGPPGVHLPPPHHASAVPLHGTPSGLELTPLSKNLHRPAYDPQRGYPQVLGGPGPQPPTGVARIASSRINQSASITTWGFGRESRYNASELRAEPTTTFTAGTCWSDYREAANDARSPLDALEVALDAMRGMAEPFCNRYMLLSSLERRVGGQGVVQFASIINTHEKAAVKFYMDRSAFQHERDLYEDTALKSMMPATLAINDNQAGQCRTPYGYVFPPYVIIERGQSLDEWARDNKNKDFITIFQAMSHSVRALRKLHSAGYAHRDIKPGNILRRPNQHDWTLIDFGCAAQIGTTASLAFSLKYAPPEVIGALESGCRTIHVDAAVDIWAIGVIAFELLTGDRAFPVEGWPVAEAEKAVLDAIAGRRPLPWEEMSEGVAQRLGKMRVLKRTVLRCLERDPCRRPDAKALLRSWDHTFDELQPHQSMGGTGAAEPLRPP